MIAAPRFARFTATCASTKSAAAFAVEAKRTCGATSIIRKGRVVEFDAVLLDERGESRAADHHMSACYYGGDETKLTFTVIPTPLGLI